jgi:hypothetical protein
VLVECPHIFRRILRPEAHQVDAAFRSIAAVTCEHEIVQKITSAISLWAHMISRWLLQGRVRRHPDIAVKALAAELSDRCLESRGGT